MFSFNPFAAPDFSDNSHLSKEIQWTDNFIPASGIPDRFVLDYAREKYNELAKSYSSLDDKADRLLRVSGVFIGILAAGYLGLDIQPLWSAIPAFVCLLLSMLFCIVVQLPHYRSSPPTVHSLLDGISQGVQGRVELWAAIGFHKATEELRVACDWRANRLVAATVLFTIGVFFLTLIPAVSALQVGPG